MIRPIAKPYTYLPDHADVDYVDGKLEVARVCATNAATPQKRRNWLDTIDILLDQRLAIADLERAQAEAAGGEVQ